jgi:hypothetical protein
MWTVPDVYYVIVIVIFILGLVTIPSGAKKHSALRDSTGSTANTAEPNKTNHEAPVANVNAEQTAMGNSYFAGQQQTLYPQEEKKG